MSHHAGTLQESEGDNGSIAQADELRTCTHKDVNPALL